MSSIKSIQRTRTHQNQICDGGSSVVVGAPVLGEVVVVWVAAVAPCGSCCLLLGCGCGEVVLQLWLCSVVSQLKSMPSTRYTLAGTP